MPKNSLTEMSRWLAAIELRGGAASRPCRGRAVAADNVVWVGATTVRTGRLFVRLHFRGRNYGQSWGSLSPYAVAWTILTLSIIAILQPTSHMVFRAFPALCISLFHPAHKDSPLSPHPAEIGTK